MMGNRKKPMLFFILILAGLSSFGQYDDKLFNTELPSFDKKGIDKVFIFGVQCVSCTIGDNSTFYFVYDSSSIVKVKTVTYFIDIDEIVKIADSTFQCNDCATIVDYATKNFDSLEKNLSGSDIIFPTYTDGKIIFTDNHSARGICFYYGIYNAHKIKYTYLSKFKNINYLYFIHNECWVYISLMNNQFINFHYCSTR